MKRITGTSIRIALVAAGIALVGATNADAQELGRLFFTPEQRAALDARRKARVPDRPAAAPVTESPTSRVDGAVQRSGGKSTVWVNGETIPESAQPDSARVTPRSPNPGRVSIPAGEGAPTYDLRVGESVDRGSGEVRDLIGEGEIRIRPNRPPAK
jgi:hypothetical protein